MTKISKLPIDQKRMNQFYDDFWSAIALLESKQEARNFLFDLLTHTERKMLAKRLQVTMMLIEDDDYQTIKSYVKVGTETIARINNWLNGGAVGLRKIVEKLISLKKRKLEERMKGKEKYMAGDLLVPAIEEGLKIFGSRLKKYQKKKSVLR